MLHSLRKRLQEYSEREAAGESLWTPRFSERVRTRVIHVMRATAETSMESSPLLVLSVAHELITTQEGLHTLTGERESPSADMFAFIQVCEDDMYPTAVEALFQGFRAMEKSEASRYQFARHPYAATFAREVNEIFAQERVGWELIDSMMVEIHSKELHSAVVEPVLRLLHQAAFAKADRQYRDAIEELSNGKPADAITDAGSALQETLEALGCDGNQLGDLVRSARKKGFLGPHDTPLLDTIEKSMHWVAADRSEMGDAHHATAATREDAWLIVHVVGAIIVRLASGQKRTK